MRCQTVFDWNLIATVRDRKFKRAFKILEELGVVHPTGLYNVLVVRVPEVHDALEELRARGEQEPGIFEVLGRVVPVTHTFRFGSVEDFEARARAVVLGWAGRLEGQSFHVRMHRRGYKGRLASPHEERFLSEALLAALEDRGAPGRVELDQPDAVIAVETLGDTAGLALWTRRDMARYPFLVRSLGLRAPREEDEPDAGDREGVGQGRAVALGVIGSTGAGIRAAKPGCG